LRRSLKETATTLLEMPAVWYGSTEKWLGRLEPGSVPDEIRTLLQQGRGLIVAMPHLGNFEISAHFFGSLGKATGLYRPPRKQGLESLMLEGRNRPGQNRMVATDRAGIKALHQALSRGEIIVILPDQQPKSRKGGAGVFAPFFGVPALTMNRPGGGPGHRRRRSGDIGCGAQCRRGSAGATVPGTVPVDLPALS